MVGIQPGEEQDGNTIGVGVARAEEFESIENALKKIHGTCIFIGCDMSNAFKTQGKAPIW